jgi:transcriptional regulatory protein RtcR
MPGDCRVGNPAAYRLIDLDLSKYDRIAMRFRQEMDDDITFLKSGIETRNKAFNALIERIERVAMKSTDPVLITGPTGAGKSNLAKRIYELKKTRRQLKGDFIEINCATLRNDAAMSALFGHKKTRLQGRLRTEKDFCGRQTKECFFWMKSANSALKSSQCCFVQLKKKNFFL